MSKPEAQMRANLVAQFKDLHMKPIENVVGIGTPDVTYIGGWMELKILAEWPARDTTVVKFKRYTKEQKMWLRDHWDLGGRSFLVLKVGPEWMAFAGPDAAVCGSITRSELESVAIIHMRSFDVKLFRYIITETQEELNNLRRIKDICTRVSELKKSYSFGAGGLAIAKSKPPLASESATTVTRTGSAGARRSLKGLPPSSWESAD